MQPTFTFPAELWLHSAGKWVFASVPEDESDEIRDIVPNPRGFGSVRVGVQIGDTSWKTSVFPSSESGTFVLPIKKAVRTAENIDVGDETTIELTILLG